MFYMKDWNHVQTTMTVFELYVSWHWTGQSWYENPPISRSISCSSSAMDTQSMGDLLSTIKMILREKEDKLSETLATSDTVIQVTIFIPNIYSWSFLTNLHNNVSDVGWFPGSDWNSLFKGTLHENIPQVSEVIFCTDR